MKRILDMVEDNKVGAITKDGELKGKIIAHWTASGVCHVGVWMYRKSQEQLFTQVKAHNFSAGVAIAFDKIYPEGSPIKINAGADTVKRDLAIAGYKYMDLI